MKKFKIIASVITLLLIGCDSQTKDNNQSIGKFTSDSSSSINYDDYKDYIGSSSSTYIDSRECRGEPSEVFFKTTRKEATVCFDTYNLSCTEKVKNFYYCPQPSTSSAIFETNTFAKERGITGQRSSLQTCSAQHFEKNPIKESDEEGSVGFLVTQSAFKTAFYLDSGIDIVSGLNSKLYYVSSDTYENINSLTSIFEYTTSDVIEEIYEYMQISDVNTSKKEVLIADVQMRIYVGLVTGYLSSLSDKNSYKRLNEYVYHQVQYGFYDKEDVFSSAFIQQIMKEYSSDLFCEDTNTFDTKVPVVSEAIETFVKQVRVKLEKSSEYKLSAKELLVFSQLEVEEDYLDNSSITFDTKAIESRLANIQ